MRRRVAFAMAALSWCSNAAAVPVPLDRVQLVPATAAQVLEAVRGAGAEVVVVNVWATWCIPCREEFPELLRLQRDYRARGVALILVSADFDSAASEAKAFLAEQGVDFRTYLKAQKDQEFIDGFDRGWSGALPATFVYDGTGKLRKALLTPVKYETLQAEVDALLGG